jgi:hypothetical protein
LRSSARRSRQTTWPGGSVAESAVTRYLDGSASLLERWRIDRRKLFHYAAEEILGLAQRGNVLIKGWGAATLLRDVPQVISVRVLPPWISASAS